MKPTMFELANQSAKLCNFNARSEVHGDDREPAADLKLQMSADNSILAWFAPSLKSALYRPADEGDDLVAQAFGETNLPCLKFPKMSGFGWDLQLVGYTLRIHYGTGGKSDIVIGDAIVDHFRIEPNEGGTVQLTFRVRCKPDEKQAGRIYTLQQRELEITLTPPADGQMDMEKAA